MSDTTNANEEKLSEEEEALLRGRLREDYLWEFGIQYYIAARAAALACLLPVVGNLYHHAVEALLKARLVKTHSPEQLKKKFKHNLPDLWDAFKAEFPGTDLDRFDDTIGSIHPFESIRYPDGIVDAGATAWIVWEQGPSTTQIRGQAPAANTEYRIVVNDMDRLVETILRTCSRNPVALTAPLNDYARDALARTNPVAGQLMKREP